jgi:hypothetical protein
VNVSGHCGRVQRTEVVVVVVEEEEEEEEGMKHLMKSEA